MSFIPTLALPHQGGGDFNLSRQASWRIRDLGGLSVGFVDVAAGELPALFERGDCGCAASEEGVDY